MITLTTLKGIYYDNDRIFSGAVLEAGNVCITCMLCNNIVRFSITNFIEYLDSTLVFVYRQRHETSNFAFFFISFLHAGLVSYCLQCFKIALCYPL